MRLLLTNDDGIDSAGLHVLAAALATTDHEVVVVAPDQDFSGAGASLGGFGRMQIRVTDAQLPGAEGVEAHALDGPPGLCVLAAQLGAFGAPPDLVVSGINPGHNSGRAVLHSGTVGAALTAQNFGRGGLAVSTVGPTEDGTSYYETAAQYALEVLELLIDAPPRSVLNLNVPGLAREDILGLRWATLAPFGEVRTVGATVEGEHLQLHLTSGGAEPDPETDQGLLAAGYATLSTLVGVTDAWPALGPAPEAIIHVDAQAVPGGAVALAKRGESETLDWPRG